MISQTPVPAQYWLSHAHVIVKLNFKHIKFIKLVLLRSDPTSYDESIHLSCFPVSSTAVTRGFSPAQDL